MRFVRLLMVLAFSLAFVASLVMAKPEYAKKEGKPCTFCHVKMGAKDLNDMGKCYKENNHSLEKCGEKAKTN